MYFRVVCANALLLACLKCDCSSVPVGLQVPEYKRSHPRNMDLPTAPTSADFACMPQFGDSNTIPADIEDRDQQILANFARFYLIALDWAIRSDCLNDAKETC